MKEITYGRWRVGGGGSEERRRAAVMGEGRGSGKAKVMMIEMGRFIKRK